jgi:flagellar basal body-associated protein FliL
MSKQGRDLARTERAAAIRAAQARQERNRRIALIGGIVVLLCAVIAGGAWYGSGSGTKTVASSVNVPTSAGPTSLGVGDKSAPVKVVI